MNLYGLIGFPLSHSFSKKYFAEKFVKEHITGSRYDLYEIPGIKELPGILEQTPGLRGLNVTIPFKQEVIPFLDDLDEASAGRIGAVNTIKIFADGSTKGYNTDYYGFRQSVEEWLDHRGESCANLKALVLGNGGAAKAVCAALTDLKADYQLVSRTSSESALSYEELTSELMQEHRLIINTTPLGMFPKVEAAPPIPYELLNSRHFLYDLVYNPLETAFIQKGKAKGAQTHNGLKMLELQAEKAWEIWTHEEDLWNR
ncbi:shikimate dehydrogenase family protein [Arundinibacter roseus]|uniref:Shikimate dehydrogenase n=1 Tax=Arundinibacter roseus TaxID=2070510 RepID=A0A4V2X9K7_9BACT|nr:shikimate dehydrogenase [Arundinibacter roseus]TDB64085.1 shikimate dehydrogenase [Arundinibacter roseus]